jgi:hypothetical protein
MKKLGVIAATGLSALAAISSVSAQANTVNQTGQNVQNLLSIFGGLVSTSIGILITLALAVFFWGLVKYLFNLGGEKGHEQGKHLMIYGIVALFVMVSVWGLVQFVQSFFGINGNSGGPAAGALLPTGVAGTGR